MRKIFTIIFLSITTLAFAQNPTYRGKALIIGDSTFSYNNFSSLFHNICSFNGDSVSIEYILYKDSVYVPFIATSAYSLKLSGTHYDYVIFNETVLKALTLSAADYQTRIKDMMNRARTMGCNNFFVWQSNAYKNGYPSLCAKYPVCCSYSSMNDWLINNSFSATKDVCNFLPSANAWDAAASKIGKNNLYQANGILPSKAGTYLYASLVYDIFRYSWGGEISNTAYPSGLSTTTERTLKQISSNFIFTNASYWHNTIPVKDLKIIYSFDPNYGKDIKLKPIYEAGAQIPYPGLAESFYVKYHGKYDYSMNPDSSGIFDVQYKYWINGTCDTMIYKKRAYYAATFYPGYGYNIPHSFYNDKNGNCIKESTEEFIHPWIQYRSPNYTFFNINKANSDTLDPIFPEDTFSISFDTLVLKKPACSRNIVVSDWANSNGYQQIPLQIKGTGKNLGVYARLRSEWFPGFDASQEILVYNQGVKNEIAYIQLKKPDSIIYVSSSLTPTKNIGNTINWQLNLSPGESVYIKNKFYISSKQYINSDHVKIEITCDSIAGDMDTTDNHFVQNIQLSGSYDPNFKEVLNTDALNRFAPIRYLVHFQNTGTGPAKRVTIMDTLSKEMVPESLKFIASSHPVQIWTNNNIVQFLFEDINLPDSGTNQDSSNGFVAFQVNVSRDQSPGIYRDTVRNKAHIYFDFNEPVGTNTSKVFAYLSSVKQIASNPAIPWNVYPNPGKNYFTIQRHQVDENISYYLIDMQGRTCMVKQVGTGTKEIRFDVPAGLPSGVYMIGDSNGHFIKWLHM